MEYTLTIPKETYGDAEWFGETVEVPRVSGHANSEFEVRFSLENESSGVDMITCEKNNSTEVYNLHGMKVSNSTDNLPAGIYVINGKKSRCQIICPDSGSPGKVKSKGLGRIPMPG